MITISNFGWRLGNQLFQIAAGYHIAKRKGDELFIPEWDYQDVFTHKFKKYSEDNIEVKIKENGFHFQKFDIPSGNFAISGYFQSWKYFTDTEISEIFEFSDVIKRAYSDNLFKDCCSVHVRRGDYLKYPDHHPLCTLDYYEQAMELSPSKKFVIFSDDIKWCEENFGKIKKIGYRFYFASPYNSDTCDFYQMSKCDHNIIGNSTFSWWSAYLNKNKDKVVISPSKDNWHGPAYAGWNHDDLLPEKWIQIKF